MLTVQLAFHDPLRGDSTIVSEFTANHDDDDEHLAKFHSQEIHIGSLLGEGNFCQIFDVTKIKLGSSFKVSPTQEKARENLVLFTKKASLHSRIAIKQLNHKQLEKCEDKLDRALSDLVSEATALSKLNHANIIQIFGLSFSCHAQNEHAFILMEKLSETLEEKIERWRVAKRPASSMVTRKVFYAYQIASALAYLHEKQLVFRDLHPRKIGFKGEIAKLCDFSKCTELPTASSSDELMVNKHAIKVPTVYPLPVAGTPRYMSPEMLLNQAYNEKTDVYSWAMVFHEMITHECPYMHCSRTQVCMKVCVLQERPLFSPEVPKAVEGLLRHSWKSNINSRLSMRNACKVLESILLER